MNLTNLINEIRICFHMELERKNEWGKNEVKEAFEKSLINVLSTYINIDEQ